MDNPTSETETVCGNQVQQIEAVEAAREELARCELAWENSPRENSIARDARAAKRARLRAIIGEVEDA